MADLPDSPGHSKQRLGWCGKSPRTSAQAQFEDSCFFWLRWHCPTASSRRIWDRRYNATMSETPTRLWFRYSLRTMFVVVTVLCLWLGWTLPTIAERQKLRSHEGVSCFVLDRTRQFIPGEVTGGKAMPITWRLLGVSRVDMIHLDSSKFDDDDLRHVSDVFPEAVVKRFTFPPSPYSAQ